MKVKLLSRTPGAAMVQLSDPQAASCVIDNLGGVEMWGSRLELR